MWELLTGEEPYASMHCGTIIGKDPSITKWIGIRMYVFLCMLWRIYQGMFFVCLASAGIVNNTLRPSIPNWCDPGWRSLMEQCWSGDPSKRPTFSDVARELRAIAASMNMK